MVNLLYYDKERFTGVIEKHKFSKCKIKTEHYEVHLALNSEFDYIKIC